MICFVNVPYNNSWCVKFQGVSSIKHAKMDGSQYFFSLSSLLVLQGEKIVGMNALKVPGVLLKY